MEKSTTLGMTLGLFAVGYGMYLKGADPHALINPAAFLIILQARLPPCSTPFR